jgi:hypothetical protein
LDDVVVLLLNAELDLGATVGVAQTQDRAVDVAGLELLDELVRVLAKAAQQVRNDLARVAGLTCEVGEGGLDASSKVPLADAQGNGLLLASFGEVRLEGCAKEVGENAFTDIVDFGQRILGSLERRKTDELNRLSELVEVLDCRLDLLEAAADCVWLEDDLEDRIADWRLL